MSRSPSVATVVEGLLKVGGENYKASGQLPPDVLISLHLIHGQSLLNALDLVDNRKVRGRYIAL